MSAPTILQSAHEAGYLHGLIAGGIIAFILGVTFGLAIGLLTPARADEDET